MRHIQSFYLPRNSFIHTPFHSRSPSFLVGERWRFSESNYMTEYLHRRTPEPSARKRISLREQCHATVPSIRLQYIRMQGDHTYLLLFLPLLIIFEEKLTLTKLNTTSLATLAPCTLFYLQVSAGFRRNPPVLIWFSD